MRQRFQELAKSFSNAETLHGQSTRELEDAFLDCRQDNWDGYDALPVAEEAFLQAQKFLKLVLPHYPAPTCSATPSGNLAFEWFVSPKRRLLVSIGEEDKIAYAGLFGSHASHATTDFIEDVPPEIADQLKRLFFLS